MVNGVARLAKMCRNRSGLDVCVLCCVVLCCHCCVVLCVVSVVK